MFERYAVYFTASDEFAQRGAEWLGWDIGAGHIVTHPNLAKIDLPILTEKPRKYGLHATIKPPFVLAKGVTQTALKTGIKNACSGLAPLTLQGLEIVALGRFLALVPRGEILELKSLAGEIVTSLDMFRAPISEEEFKYRNRENLTSSQYENLCNWGYPHVLDQFQFHMTLTGRIPKSDLAQVQKIAAHYFAEHMQTSLDISSLTLVGQGVDGYFVEIERFPLGFVDQ